MKAHVLFIFIIVVSSFAHADYGWTSRGIDPKIRRHEYSCALQTDQGGFVSWEQDILKCNPKMGFAPKNLDSDLRRWEYGCAYLTQSGDFVTWANSNSDCSQKFSWVNKKIDSTLKRWEYGCALVTENGEFVTWADDFKDCKQNYGWSIKRLDEANRRWEYACALQTDSKDFIRFIGNEMCVEGTTISKDAPRSQLAPQISIEELNKKIQPPEGSQIILSVDLGIPGQKGCGTPQESNSGVQCWVCQNQAIRNGILYTKERILEVQSVKMSSDRKEFHFNLVNDTDGLSLVRCISKQPNIQVNAPEDLAKLLQPSGLRFMLPSFIVK